MYDKRTITTIGLLVLTGLVIQILTSTLFEGLQDFVKTYMTVRDFICLLGQDIGEALYAFGFWILFKKRGVFLAVVEYWMSLLAVDLFTIIFLNPYESPPAKWIGFLIATVILLIRLKSYYGNTASDTK